MRIPRLHVLILLVTIAGCQPAPDVREVDDSTLRSADADADNWVSYGRTYSEQRVRPLKQIDEQTVGRLGLAWSQDLETLRRLEATSLVRDGVLYTTGAWSIAYAVDARTGRLLWTY